MLNKYTVLNLNKHVPEFTVRSENRYEYTSKTLIIILKRNSTLYFKLNFHILEVESYVLHTSFGS